jgi:transposase-like protein
MEGAGHFNLPLKMAKTECRSGSFKTCHGCRTNLTVLTITHTKKKFYWQKKIKLLALK